MQNESLLAIMTETEADELAAHPKRASLDAWIATATHARTQLDTALAALESMRPEPSAVIAGLRQRRAHVARALETLWAWQPRPGGVIPRDEMAPESMRSYNADDILVIYGQTMRTRDVYVRAAKKQSRGNGLYAAREFKKGETIVEYDGVRVRESQEDRVSELERDYAVEIFCPSTCREGRERTDPVTLIVAYPYVKKDALRRIAGFANHKTHGHNARTYPDFDLDTGETVAFLVANARIPRDAQITWDYGKEYAERKGWKY